MTSARTLPLVVLALFLACGGSQRAPEAPAVAPPPVASPRAALFHTDAPLGATGLRLPSPLIRGTVGGRRTILIVDTGAQIPVIAGWLAREAGLERRGVIRGADPAGQGVPMERTDRPRVAIDGWGPLADRPTAIAELPPQFEELGIGAVVSPQALATRDEAVVLDMPRGEMWRAPLARAKEALAELENPLVVGATRVCAHRDGDMDVRALIGEASIDGTIAALEFDTGTNKIFVAADSEPGLRLAARSDASKKNGLGAAGAFPALVAKDVAVRIGDASLVADIAVTGRRDGRCGIEGRFGMDHLASCVLVIGASELHAACKRP